MMMIMIGIIHAIVQLWWLHNAEIEVWKSNAKIRKQMQNEQYKSTTSYMKRIINESMACWNFRLSLIFKYEIKSQIANRLTTNT